MRRTRIKICGITRPEDALSAVRLGVDAIGLVFYAGSPRYVDLARACEIADQIPAFVSRVALFFDNTEEEVQQVLQTVSVDLAQFHGSESATFCEQFGVDYIKAVPMLAAETCMAHIHAHPKAKGFLLDATRPGEPGGTGRQFDWQQMPTGTDRALILAGGLTPENVRTAILQTNCYAVDTSSGVEAVKGIKDLKKMKEFIEQVRIADIGSN